MIPEATRAHYAEKVIYLPDSFMVNDCDRKISERLPSRTEAGLPEMTAVLAPAGTSSLS